MSTWATGMYLTPPRLGQWQTYTPAWTASTTNPTLGDGTATGRYVIANQLMHWWAEIVIGSTTTLGSGAYFLGAPAGVTFRTGTPEQRVGCTVRTAGSVLYEGSGRVFTTTVGLTVYAGGAGGPLVGVTGTAPASLTAGASLTVWATTELV